MALLCHRLCAWIQSVNTPAPKVIEFLPLATNHIQCVSEDQAVLVDALPCTASSDEFHHCTSTTQCRKMNWNRMPFIVVAQ